VSGDADLAAPEALEKIAEYRRAARLIVEAVHVDYGKRGEGLIKLAAMAAAEVDPVVSRWSQIALWHEARVFCGVNDEEPKLPPESFENRQRRLRLVEGLDRCDRCYSRIADEQDLARWHRLRLAEAERLEAHKGAVS